MISGTLHLPGTPHHLSNNGGQEGLGWGPVEAGILNRKSFHFPPSPGWVHPAPRSHGPRNSALRAAWGGGGAQPATDPLTSLGTRREGQLPLGRWVQEGPGTGRSCRATRRAPPTHGPRRLTLRSLRPSPRSHPPRQRPLCGPWRAPCRALLAGAGVTRGTLPRGRPARCSQSWRGWLLASPRPG